MGVGMPQQILLHQFGKLIFDAFGEWPYHVGSSVFDKAGWRDVDVRVMLDDAEYERVVGGPPVNPPLNNKRWCALCLAFSIVGREMTGLPIDFQIQQTTEANRLYGDKPRSALILCAEF